jgi:hypothetical protein
MFIRKIEYEDEVDESEERESSESYSGQLSGMLPAVWSGQNIGLAVAGCQGEPSMKESNDKKTCCVDARELMDTCQVLSVTGGRNCEIEKKRGVNQGKG